MYLKNKLNENDIKLLEKINIKINDRQYGCGEIYEIAEHCTFKGEIFYTEKDSDLSEQYMFLIDKLLAYGDLAYSGEEEGQWYASLEELKEKIINQEIVIVNFKHEYEEYEIANIFDKKEFFDIEQDEDELIESQYGYPVYRFVNDEEERKYYYTLEDLLSDVKIQGNSIEDIFNDIIFY